MAFLLLVRLFGTYISEIWIEIQYSFKKISWAKRRPFCCGRNVLNPPREQIQYTSRGICTQVVVLWWGVDALNQWERTLQCNVTSHWLSPSFSPRRLRITSLSLGQLQPCLSIRNIFRVTGPSWGDFTGHRWIPLTKASAAELWCFLWSAPEFNGWANHRDVGDFRRHFVHYDVTVMRICFSATGHP